MSKTNPFNKFLSAEQREHTALCKWLSLQYPNLLWWHTPNESKKTPFERFLFTVMGGKRGVSDFVFIEPKGEYSGLFIELKATGIKTHKKNGECYYPEQELFLNKAKERGFYATFAVGFDEAKKVIESYMNNKL